MKRLTERERERPRAGTKTRTTKRKWRITGQVQTFRKFRVLSDQNRLVSNRLLPSTASMESMHRNRDISVLSEESYGTSSSSNLQTVNGAMDAVVSEPRSLLCCWKPFHGWWGSCSQICTAPPICQWKWQRRRQGCWTVPAVPLTKQLPFRVRPPSWHILYRLWTNIICPGWLSGYACLSCLCKITYCRVFDSCWCMSFILLTYS